MLRGRGSDGKVVRGGKDGMHPGRHCAGGGRHLDGQKHGILNMFSLQFFYQIRQNVSYLRCVYSLENGRHIKMCTIVKL